MKKNVLNLVLMAILSLAIFSTSCRKDKDPAAAAATPQKIMTDYMKANSMDLSDMITGWLITAHDLDSIGTDEFYIIDLRADTAFTRGHVPGAVNSTLGNVVTEATNASDTTPVVVVCYTGQSAAHAVVALRLSGYSDAKILKFGMSSWNGAFDSWTLNTGDVASGHAEWSTINDIEGNVVYSVPAITSTSTDGATILAARVAAMLSGGFKGVTNASVLATPTDYFINNYWADTDVDHYGHIVGAHRVKEALTLAADGFKNLDKDATIVTYCWTGQTSSAVTAYLNVLGYDAKSLKFGTNGMIYSDLASHKWVSSGTYTVE